MSEVESVNDGNSTHDGASHANGSMASLAIKESFPFNLPSKVLREFKVSMAYTKSLTKDKCSLCLMYFNRSTVCYKVPNHRLFELQKRWNLRRQLQGATDVVEKEGRRYENASFLYQTNTVCTFCAQFFTQLPEEVKADPNRDGGYGILASSMPSEDNKFSLTTPVLRQDIAEHQNAYQSSTVDHKDAHLAITPPYEVCSRTRREADPWWEVEFGRFVHIHSVLFEVTVGVRQTVEVSVLLLPKPIGFEDPFLDSVRSHASQSILYTFSAQGKARTEKVCWELPAHAHGYALRIQLRGVMTLCLGRVQALQGNDLLLPQPEDLDISATSLASLSPQSLQSALREMRSPSRTQPPPGGSGSAPASSSSFSSSRGVFDPFLCIDAVSKLTQEIRTRYHHVDAWRDKVLGLVRLFPPDELLALYRVVFKYVADMNLANAGKHPLAEHELLTHGLVAHYPRADLTELHQRLRSVVRWIQTRSHLKVLGALLTSDLLLAVANSPSDQLYHLMTAFKRVEYYWNKREQQQQQQQQQLAATAGEEAEEGGGRVVRPKVAEFRGCSWSQFLMIMALFGQMQCERIPEEVFKIEKQYAQRRMLLEQAEDLCSQYSAHSGSGRSVSTYSLSIMRPNPVLRQQRLRAAAAAEEEEAKLLTPLPRTAAGVGRGRPARDGPGSRTPSLESWSVASMPWLMQRGDLLASKSLVDSVREKGHPAPFDSSFSEYKFAHLKKKLSKDVPFPRELSLEFARTLLSNKGATMTLQAPDDLMLGGQLEGSVSSARIADDDQSRASNTSSLTGLGSFELPSVPLPVRPHRMSSMGNLGRSMRFSFDADDSKPVQLTPAKSAKMLQPLTRANTAVSLGGQSEGSRGVGPSRPSTLHKSKSATTVRSKASHQPSAAATATAPTSAAADDDVDDLDDLLSESSASQHREVSQELAAIDFFRVCALCEKRFPRSAVEFKVVRKHIVQLRSTWDPRLVSKEVRSLDNTISMYNLYYVCVFCAQFFDPDFPDGIAYPTRKAAQDAGGSKVTESLVLRGSEALTPYYDVRYQPSSIEVGDVLKRPQTVEARKRAQRATEVAHEMAEKQRKVQEAFLANEEAMKRMLL